MNNVNTNLRPNEEIVFKAKLNMGAVVVPLVLLILGAIGAFFDLGPSLSAVRIPALVLFVIGIWGTAVGLARRFTTELFLTNHRILGKTGFPKPTPVEAELNKVDRVQVERSLLGRILGYATLVVSISGQGRGRQHFPQLDNAQQLANQIHDQINTRRNEPR